MFWIDGVNVVAHQGPLRTLSDAVAAAKAVAARQDIGEPAYVTVTAVDEDGICVPVITDGHTTWYKTNAQGDKSMYTNTSQARANELKAAGYEVWLSPTGGFYVKNAPYKTGDTQVNRVPLDAFRY